MAQKIREDGNSFAEWARRCRDRGDDPIDDDTREAFRILRYEPDWSSPLLTTGFIEAVEVVCDEHHGEGLPPGILCSKVIDYCLTQQKVEKTLSENNGSVMGASGYYWPPDFKKHRDQLREQERRAKAKATRAA